MWHTTSSPNYCSIYIIINSSICRIWCKVCCSRWFFSIYSNGCITPNECNISLSLFSSLFKLSSWWRYLQAELLEPITVVFISSLIAPSVTFSVKFVAALRWFFPFTKCLRYTKWMPHNPQFLTSLCKPSFQWRHLLA